MKFRIQLPPKAVRHEIARFGVIGLSALLVNFLVVVLLVDEVHVLPLVANIFAFCTAFWVSYFGHKSWTFRAKDTSHRTALRRFIVIAVVNFSLTEGLYSITLKHFTYTVALLLVLVTVPCVTFTLGKFWAFRE